MYAYVCVHVCVYLASFLFGLVRSNFTHPVMLIIMLVCFDQKFAGDSGEPVVSQVMFQVLSWWLSNNPI